MSINFPIVRAESKHGITIPPPIITSEREEYLNREALKGERIRKTAWPALPGLFCQSLKAIHPDLKSPRTIPALLWVQYVAVYEAWHLASFSSGTMSTYDLEKVGHPICWGGDMTTLLLVQLTVTKAQFDRNNP
jgi:hypothetical protein